MVCIMTNTGLLSENFFPRQTGSDYEPSRYLNPLGGLRGSESVFNHVDGRRRHQRRHRLRRDG
jgi:hypothetical protein